MTKTETIYRDMVQECADTARSKANRLVMMGLYPRFYIYCRPSTETGNGSLYALTASEKPDESWQLVTTESLPPSLPYDRYFQWLWERCRQAPLFAYGKQSA